MSELMGQTNIGDYLPDEKPETSVADGYDAEGRLLDYVPEETADAGTSSALRAPSPEGKAFGETDDTEARLNTLVAEVHVIEGQVRSIALSAAIEIGKRLMEAKGIVPHGRFREWLAANLDYSERRAQDLMRLAEQYGRGTIPESVSRLDYSKAVALLGAPEEAREELAERAADEDMSVRALQDEIKRLKAEKLKAQMTIEGLEGRVAGQVEEIARLDEREQNYDRAIKRMEADVSAMRGTADAANRTAEALRKERDVAKTNADTAAKRASDAVSRANEAQAQLTEARQEIEALKAREPERVEVVPPEVQAELERLRSAAPRGEAEVRFRLAFQRLGAEFKAVTEILAEVNREDADKGAQFARAVATTCKRMVEMLGVEA